VDSKLKNEMSKMARTHISFGSIRSYYNDHNSVNSRLSNQQVVNLVGGHDRVGDAVRGFTRKQKREAKKAKKDSASEEEEEPTLSSPDELFLFLRANNYPYCSLTDVQESSGIHSATRLVTEIDATPVSVVDAHCESPQLDENKMSSSPVELASDEQADLFTYAQETRSTRNLCSDQKLLVACAWVTPEEWRLFQLYGNVLYIDVTNDTNQEKRPMLTIVVKDGNGKTYTVLRCLMPHECRWIFRWLFKISLPTLLGRDNLKRVNVVITDGDTQETAVLDDCIDTLFLPNGAVRVRCLWHAVNYKMKQSVLGYF
jgi:hypothetical protein